MGLWSLGRCLWLIMVAVLSSSGLVLPHGPSPDPAPHQHPLRAGWDLVFQQLSSSCLSWCVTWFRGGYPPQMISASTFSIQSGPQSVFLGWIQDRERPSKSLVCCGRTREQLSFCRVVLIKKKKPKQKFYKALLTPEFIPFASFLNRDFLQYFSFYRDSLLSLFIETFLLLSSILEEGETS